MTVLVRTAQQIEEPYILPQASSCRFKTTCIIQPAKLAIHNFILYNVMLRRLYALECIAHILGAAEAWTCQGEWIMLSILTSPGILSTTSTGQAGLALIHHAPMLRISTATLSFLTVNIGCLVSC